MNSPLAQTLRMNRLIDLYGALLTPHQQRIMSWYFSMDLSLGEISTRLGVSRQAVRDAVVRASGSLEEFEKCLRLAAQGERRRRWAQDCLQAMESMDAALSAVAEAEYSTCRAGILDAQQSLQQLVASMEGFLHEEDRQGREGSYGL